MRGISAVIVAATLLNSLGILLYLPFLRTVVPEVASKTNVSWVVTFGLVYLLNSFLEELAFMPSIILATTCSSNHEYGRYVSGRRQENDGIHYGLLVSCIDFGDQISDWFIVPIVSYLDIRRENDWHNLDWFLWICVALAALSLMFLMFLGVVDTTMRRNYDQQRKLVTVLVESKTVDGDAIAFLKQETF